MIEDLEPEGYVLDLIPAHKPKRNIRKPLHFLDMVVAYALPVEIVKDSFPSTFREIELSLNCRGWLWWKRLSLFMSTTHENLQSYPKRRKPLDANEFMQRKKNLRMAVCVTRPD